VGHCRYAYNTSEIYARTPPGAGVETHCGAATWPAVDEPEMVPVTVTDDDGTRTEYRHTGEYLPRAQPDPYCPAHGGMAAPPPRVLTLRELAAAGEQLEAQRRAYVEELERAGVEIPGALQPGQAIGTVPEGAA
jgi:hypothetical protein